ncbi:MAG: hypothetical protein A2Y38_23520 [Spirochaetes bacterium GWB1_59_5]|nr:MAG: hypothetical protein A2Y38_23520 [Spirochaetes bacterium GWB1_59_5]
MNRAAIDELLRPVRHAVRTAVRVPAINPQHFHGPDVTVVLVDESNIKPGESRLVHTYMIRTPGRSTAFQANDDDRGAHDDEDEGVTWVHGHVSDDSPEGLALLAAAKLTDVE